MSSLLKHDVVYVVASLFKMYNFLITQNYFFRDTDSLTYEIETEDVYQDFWNDKDKFDNSDYPENYPYSDKTNKKVIGKLKDETSSMAITHD